MGAEGLATPARQWRVVSSSGWERKCSSEWAAQSAGNLHPQLALMDVAHWTQVEGPMMMEASGNAP